MISPCFSQNVSFYINFLKEIMKENTKTTYLVVETNKGKPSSRMVFEAEFNTIAETSPNKLLIGSQADLAQLVREYEDVTVENGAQLYPELNTLSTYLLQRLVDVEGDGQPLSRQILVSTPLVRRKAQL